MNLKSKSKKNRDIYSFIHENLKFSNQLTSDHVDENLLASFISKQSAQVDVLILEDDLDMTKLLENFFEQNQMKTFSIVNSLEAIKIYEQIRPQFVTVDLNLKDSLGHRFLEYIRELKSDQKPWVILVSSANARDIDSALLDGADFYFSKPVDFLSMKKLLERFCSISKSA